MMDKRFITDMSNLEPFEEGPQEDGMDSFKEFEAMELYCTRCQRPVPVRKNLLLVLPEGDKYEYRCVYCGNTVGDKIDKSGQFHTILKLK